MSTEAPTCEPRTSEALTSDRRHPTNDISAPARRVLVVEDETAIAILIERRLQQLGYVVVGPVSKLKDALLLAASGGFDAAVLDVTIRGGNVYPVAEALLARGIPFVLASGYSEWALPETLRGQPRLTKPFRMDEFDEQIALLFPTKA
jgi:CheY-like chemotaxis protein